MPGHFDTLVWFWCAVAAVTFVVLFRINAPYGRYARSGWGPALPATAAWMSMEIASPATMAWFAYRSVARGTAALVLLGAWQVHYLHRTLIYPIRVRGTHRLPLSIVAMGALFNLVNGGLNGWQLFGRAPSPYGDAWLSDPRFVVGLLIFVTGLLVNLHSDEVLLRLRARARASGVGGYAIPERGLHRLVAAPNYFGEIVEWIGWAVASWSAAGLSFALWTIANLAPRAAAHRRWYRATFASYPAERRALVPFIW